jgi:hypothetical protein
MKKIVIALIMGAAVMLTVGCKKDQKDNIRPVTTTQIMLNALKKDYQTVIKSYPDALDRLVEARCTLDHRITEVSSVKDLNVVSMSEIYYIGYFSTEHRSHIVYMDRDFEGNTTSMTYDEPQSPWLGDYRIPLASLDSMITLEQAIRCVMASDYATPNTRYVNLRYPVYSFDKGHAMYVFGGYSADGKHLWVDAYTGEVYSVDDDQDNDDY